MYNTIQMSFDAALKSLACSGYIELAITPWTLFKIILKGRSTHLNNISHYISELSSLIIQVSIHYAFLIKIFRKS